MFIKKLKIENFRTLNGEFEFDKINLITGANGKGKSSLIEVLDLFMTGSLDSKLEYYVNWDYPESGFSISGEFKHRDIERGMYDIKYKAGVTDKLLKIKRGESYKGKEATEYLKNLFPPTLVRYSSLSKQDESYAILKKTPMDKFIQLKTVLGIDVLDKIQEKIAAEMSELKIKTAELQKEVESLEATKYNFMEEVIINENIDEIESKRKDLEIKVNELQKQQQDYAFYQEQLREYSKYQAVVVELNALEKPEGSLKKLTQDLDILLSSQKKAAEKNRLEADLEKYPSRDKPAAFSGDPDALQKELETLVSQCPTLEKQIKLIALGKCPECGSEIHTSEGKSLSDYEKDLAHTKKEIDRSRAALIKISAEKTVYIEQLQKWKSTEEYRNKLLSELKSLGDVQDVSDEEIKKCSALIQSHKDYESKTGFLQTQLDKFDVKEEPVEKKPPQSLDEINREFKEIEKTLIELKQKIKQKETVDAFNREVQKTKDQNTTRKSEIQALLDESNYQLDYMKSERSLFKNEFPVYLIQKGTTFIEEGMNAFFQKCYKRYKIYFRQPDNKPNSIDFLYSKDKDSRLVPTEIASGYEKQLLALSFRVAIANMTGIGLYALDEADSNSDENNSIELYKNFLEYPFEQIYIITHKKETIEFLMNNYSGVKLFEF